MLFNLGDADNKVELYWNNLHQKEEFSTFSRLIIGSKEREIPLILEFCKQINGPFGVLHVLLVSRLGKELGRYQTPQPLSYDELELFLYEHQEYFEHDGRHHLWISSMSGEGQFIFDNHNFIYAYGDISSFISLLTNKGFKEGQIKISVPHTHNYHAGFDAEEEAVNNQFEWLYSPLQESDDR